MSIAHQRVMATKRTMRLVSRESTGNRIGLRIQTSPSSSLSSSIISIGVISSSFSTTFLASFSVNIRMMNSPLWLGSNVDGIMQYRPASQSYKLVYQSNQSLWYKPGFNRKRALISRKLMNVGDLATEAL